jgi:glycine betaine/proline transport system substrate-binding protein
MINNLNFIFFIIFLAAPKIYASSCHKVRIADIGWTDISATTALTAELLKILGYETKISLLATPVAFAGLKNNDVDLFLGNWMPSMEADIRPYLNDKSLIQLAKNLEGARYTLAVPRYVYKSGVHSFSDLYKYSDRFDHKIYGIEAGNDGNRLILDMISANAFNSGNFELIESSEQAMLMSVAAAIKKQEWIVFLGWSPHPMNLSFELEYLAGGDEYFGAHFGASEVFSIVRKDLPESCPELTKFIKNLKFNIALENEIMNLILNEKKTPEAAARIWLKNNPEIAQKWLHGHKKIKNSLAAPHKIPPQFSLPIGAWMEKAVLFLTRNFSNEFQRFADTTEIFFRVIITSLVNINWIILVSFITFISYIIRRNILISFITSAGFIIIISMGLWVETVETLVLVLCASGISILFGVPLGIVSAHYDNFYRLLRPMLDFMQTIPTFVYLIPTLMLFGLGIVPGLISTIIFSIAAPIRLSYLGIKSVPPELNEAACAFGANWLQRLIKIEIPHAWPSIIVGFTQCVMLSLSMVVIAALVGADGLGGPVVRALNTVNIRQGFESGLAIVILAIILDRIVSISEQKRR